MNFSPLVYQHLGIDWLKERKEAALFAGMGLGKSAMTLAALDHLLCDGEIKGALIIAPLRVSVLTWPHEIQKWDEFSWMKTALLRTEEGVQAWLDGSADIYLLNYERIPQFCKACLHGRRKRNMPVQAVVWDELSKAKSPDSKRINLFRHYRDRFEYHWGLTGTPRPNGFFDLFAQVRLLDDGKRLGKSSDAFKKTYFEVKNPHSDYPKWEPREGVDDFITKKVSDLALTLRSEDWLNIPPTTKEDIEVTLPAAAMKAYRELQKEFLTELEDRGLEVVALGAGAKLQKLLQITSGSVYDEERTVGFVHDKKIKALQKLQKDLGEPMLVATQFRHEQARILKACPGAELFRNDSLERWERGEIPMLVADPLSIGHGVDRLQHGGRVAVWFTPTYSREAYDQFNSRVARMGQEEETRIFHIICPGTVDDAVLEVLRMRGEGQSEFLSALKNLQELARAA